MNTPNKNPESSSDLSLNPNAAWERIRGTQKFLDVPTVSAEDSNWSSPSSDCTRIVCISDTHGQHREIAVPKGDILIHAGDFTQTGEVKTIQDLARYFQELKFPATVCIAGNHDLTLDLPYYQRSWRRFHRKKLNAEEGRQCILDLVSSTANSENNFYFLEDSSCSLPLQGGNPAVTVYGSPWSAEFYDWAFNVPRGAPSLELWSKIPTETDVLITHGPHLGRGDLCANGVRAGCYDLLHQIQGRIKPRLMIFGHIHEGYGTSYDGTTIYVNASNLDFDYENVHPCTVIDLPHDKSLTPRLVLPRCRLRAEDLPAWFQQNGYEVLMRVLERAQVDAAALPSGNDLLQTAQAYKSILRRLEFRKTEDLGAKKELRKALLQIHAESF